jgi:hypothetical protein
MAEEREEAIKGSRSGESGRKDGDHRIGDLVSRAAGPLGAKQENCCRP